MELAPLALTQLDKITLSELLSALSHALDLTEGQPASSSRHWPTKSAHCRGLPELFKSGSDVS
jgi:hypothetical protein